MNMTERRQHFRIDDEVYFNYKVLKFGESNFNESITEELLGGNGLQFLEAMNYFDNINQEITGLTQQISLTEPNIAHYLNLLNSKIEFISHWIFMGGKVSLRKVNLSLGGISFDSATSIPIKSQLKIVIFTKPKLVPVLLDAHVVYSRFEADMYRTAVEFYELSLGQEKLLSEHIMMSQIKMRCD